MAKSPGYDCEKANEHEAVTLALGVCQEEGLLEAAVRAGEVEILGKSLHRMGPPFIGRLEDTVLTVRALRKYVESIHGFLEVEGAPEPQDQTLNALKDSAKDAQVEKIKYYWEKFPRLQPCTEWKGGMIADTDLVTLDEAAHFASRHAGNEITSSDFLRAAGRGQIPLRAIVHRGAKVKKHDGGIYCNSGTPTENFVPNGSIPTLPLTACQHLAAAGRASWRTFDGFEEVEGEQMRYTTGQLIDCEPDFETTPADCRVTGNDVHAFADAFIKALAQSDATPAPMVAETTEQRRARWLDWYGKGERGAVQRVYQRELLLNPKADRSFIGKQIDIAKSERAAVTRSGGWTSQLVQDGKRKG